MAFRACEAERSGVVLVAEGKRLLGRGPLRERRHHRETANPPKLYHSASFYPNGAAGVGQSKEK
jgi:hypothetical protein